MASYHDHRFGFHSIEIWGELLDHYARPLSKGAQLTALSLNRGRVEIYQGLPPRMPGNRLSSHNPV